ncbi:hypothetical protein LHYA1_G006953 [Lachnellula hyalina]|uniref:DUF8004 domain-containing protein n=1 Tax=Lachnellula hyalina TaxID=1316788 RepID=A0A8H8TVV2_9HELO|nr:uncharacterized protein LHYA1_G006953 [Lachnellula hyalina]TVY24204.1 hypothetical protein LHYA1_G006953 [Lachnellula hyalina]
MADSEYTHDFFPDFPSGSFNLLPLQKLAQKAAMEAAKPRARLQKSTQRSTRLQRLSTFLPSLSTSPTRSKHSEGTKPSPLPAISAPLPIDIYASSSRPPSRDAPLAPWQIFQANNDNDNDNENDKDMPPPPAPPQKRLQKSDSPNRLKSLPNVRSGSPSRKLTTPSSGKASRRNSILAMIPGQNRSVSSPVGSRPNSVQSGEDDEAAGFKTQRKSFLLGGSRSRSRNTSKEIGEEFGTGAWVNAGEHKIDYNLALLTGGEKVPELWEDNADTFIYLFPQASGLGPSFKVPSMTLSSSVILMHYINAQQVSSPATGRPSGQNSDGRNSLSVEDAARHLSLRGPASPPYTPKTSISDIQSSSDGRPDSLESFLDAPRETHLYFPTGLTSDGSQLSPNDIQDLVDIRNLFAFLTGQPLVGTKTRPSTFRIFLQVGAMLSKFQFTNLDGSTFGESASASFEFYLEELKLSDVRESREKTLEGIILGEAMRSGDLYTEAFTHAVGKYTAVMQKDYPLVSEISKNTRVNLERAHQELITRQHSASAALTDFNFYSLFAGIGSSATSEESKFVRFKAWKLNFASMKRHVMSYLKDVHGHWPPKASHKKGLAGGLNRMVLKGLYSDMCSLYELRADREAITTRSMDASDDSQVTNVSPTSTALRKLLSEFDRSSPPVMPPIPFDVPLVPSIAAIDPTFQRMSPKKQHKASTRKLKEHEVALILAKTHNADCNYKTPFLEEYKIFEEKEGKGKNAQELADMVYGHWLFMYAVIQSLPMLVIDAPGLRYTGGVEYFLCMLPTGKPWVEGSDTALYSVHGGAIVSMPNHVIEAGPEAVYRRSHCWTVAEQWISKSEGKYVEVDERPSFLPEILSPLAPPPGFGGILDIEPPTAGSPGGSPTMSPMSPMSPTERGRDSRKFSGAQLGADLGANLDADERRSRSRQAQRKSIALGLERLPIPAGHETFNSRPGSSRGASPGGFKTQSPVGFYNGGNGSMARLDTPPDNSGATFNDILGHIEDPKQAKGKKGKK